MLLLLNIHSLSRTTTDTNYRSAYIISQILTSSSPLIRASLSTKMCLNILFDYIEKPVIRQSVFDQYICDIFHSVLNTYPDILIEQFLSRKTASHLVNHLARYPMCTIFLNFISTVQKRQGTPNLISVCSYLLSFSALVSLFPLVARRQWYSHNITYKHQR